MRPIYLIIYVIISRPKTKDGDYNQHEWLAFPEEAEAKNFINQKEYLGEAEVGQLEYRAVRLFKSANVEEAGF